MKYRFIAMFDILGFKSLIEQKGIESIHQLMGNLFRSAREGTSRDHTATINGVVYRYPAVRLNYFIFSDTILVWKDYKDIIAENQEIIGRCEPFREFNHGISMLLEIALLKNIYLRGGIAFGRSIIKIDNEGQNHEIIVQPIVDSYLVGEAQNWIGVAFHSSCLTFIEQKCDPTVIEYPIPYNKKKLKLISIGRETNYSLEWGGKVKEVLEKITKDLKKRKVAKKILRNTIILLNFVKIMKSTFKFCIEILKYYFFVLPNNKCNRNISFSLKNNELINLIILRSKL